MVRPNCALIESAPAAASRLHPLQLLFPDIASASAAALECVRLLSRTHSTNLYCVCAITSISPHIRTLQNSSLCMLLRTYCVGLLGVRTFEYRIARNIPGVQISFFSFSVYQNENLTYETYVMMGVFSCVKWTERKLN